MMKNVGIMLLLCIANYCFGQVAVEKTSVDGDGILDFPSNTKKGIILPGVTSLPSGAEGTILFDRTDNKVKYYDGTAWENLTEDTGSARSQDNTVGEAVSSGPGVIIGANTSSVEGVLVLESSNKALILPKIAAPHLNVVNPEAGMICYDTTNQIIAIFNGNTWEFWD
ncbi:hypothetical protein UJ101_02213 [Flavobacteriaceae bacterium UJ101]|nr:hypothetical protein UJ101_02213 [Flavobacteriaceae bacterium UJ101]